MKVIVPFEGINKYFEKFSVLISSTVRIEEVTHIHRCSLGSLMIFKYVNGF